MHGALDRRINRQNDYMRLKPFLTKGPVESSDSRVFSRSF